MLKTINTLISVNDLCCLSNYWHYTCIINWQVEDFDEAFRTYFVSLCLVHQRYLHNIHKLHDTHNKRNTIISYNTCIVPLLWKSCTWMQLTYSFCIPPNYNNWGWPVDEWYWFLDTISVLWNFLFKIKKIIEFFFHFCWHLLLSMKGAAKCMQLSCIVACLLLGVVMEDCW